MFNTEFLAQITLLRKYLLGRVLSACLFTYAIYVLPSRIYPRRDGGGGGSRLTKYLKMVTETMLQK